MGVHSRPTRITYYFYRMHGRRRCSSFFLESPTSRFASCEILNFHVRSPSRFDVFPCGRFSPRELSVLVDCYARGERLVSLFGGERA